MLYKKALDALSQMWIKVKRCSQHIYVRKHSLTRFRFVNISLMDANAFFLPIYMLLYADSESEINSYP